jgi:hypothetical protein
MKRTDLIRKLEDAGCDRTVQIFNIVKEELTFSHKYTLEEFAKP